MNPAKLVAVSLFTSAVLLSGCTTPAKTADATQEKAQAVKQESPQNEPQVYSSVGSWIPRKVQKKADVIGTNTQTASSEALAKAQQQGTSHTTPEPAPR